MHLITEIKLTNYDLPLKFLLRNDSHLDSRIQLTSFRIDSKTNDFS